MMPVPHHLRGIVSAPVGDGDTCLKADVCCPCGGKRFEVLFPGAVADQEGKDVPAMLEVNGTFFFLINVLCESCKCERLLFDHHFHGWNGILAHNAKEAAKQRPALSVWKCTNCSGRIHEVKVEIITEGKEFILEEGEDLIDEARWQDAYGAFNLHIKCCTCVAKTDYWVNFETA